MCLCASSSAISQAQILKLFSEETTIKENTHHPLSLVFRCLFFPSSHLSHSPSFFLTLLVFLHPYLFSLPHSFLSLSLSLSPRCPSFQPLPLCANLKIPRVALLRPMATAKRGCEEERQPGITPNPVIDPPLHHVNITFALCKPHVLTSWQS